MLRVLDFFESLGPTHSFGRSFYGFFKLVFFPLTKRELPCKVSVHVGKADEECCFVLFYGSIHLLKEEQVKLFMYVKVVVGPRSSPLKRVLGKIRHSQRPLQALFSNFLFS